MTVPANLSMPILFPTQDDMPMTRPMTWPKPSNTRRGGACLLALFLGSLTVALPAAAQQHAHTHGRMAMDVAVDSQSITLAVESPLDGFLGFERSPRTDAERKRVSDMQARLKAADLLFQPDPSAGCKLSKVKLDSEVLGLDSSEEHLELVRGHVPAQRKDHDHDHADDHGQAEEHGHAEDHSDDGHADIRVSVVFACDKVSAARFIDAKLFDAFQRIRQIDVQVASPQGQFKRTLQPQDPRLDLRR
jgi:hypothetical protein